MKSEKLLLKTFQVKKTNSDLKQYLIPKKNFSKSIGEVENMSLKNKALFGGWISMALKVFRREKNMH